MFLLPEKNNLGISLEYKEQVRPGGLPEAFTIGEKFINKDSVCLILGDNFFYGQSLTNKLEKALSHKIGARIFLKDVNFQTKKLYSIAVILLIAGAIGNFIDRMVYKEVIDFIDFIIFGYDFPIFNIADICLVIGMIMFGIDVLLEDVLHGKFKNRRSV